MTQDEIIEMARASGFMPAHDKRVQHFAKLVEAKEREYWKKIVEEQRLRLKALNEIIGGEDSTTTGNILSYSRWEMRLEDAVKEERVACFDAAFDAHATTAVLEAIRARGSSFAATSND